MRPRRTDRPPLGAPLLLVNLKAYPSSIGPAALRIANTLGELGQAMGVSVAIAPATPDLARVAAHVRYPVLAQHVDLRDAGPVTGFVPPEAAAAAGARGSLVNHSEHPLPPREVGPTVRKLTELGLAAVVCAGTVRSVGHLAATRPPYLAIEPPELIGGHRAVSTARPQVIVDAVAAARRVARSVRLLCGAGVHDRRDVARALELGSSGVLVSSAIARSSRPRAAIEELLAGF